MKKTLIALSLCGLINSQISLADQVRAGTINKATKVDETVVVTANRSIQEKFDTLAAVDIFTRDNI